MKSLIITIRESNRYSTLINFLLAFIFLYSYGIDLNSKILQFFLIFFSFTLIAFDSSYKMKPITWLFILTLLIFDLFQDYYFSANHHFALIYICSVILISSFFANNSDNIISHNFRSILILILLFSVIHKLLSFEFTNGSYLSFLGLDGSLFKPFRALNSYDEIIIKNQETIELIKTESPQSYPSSKLLVPFSYYSNFMIVFSYLTIAFEFLIAILAIFKVNKLLNYVLPIFLISLLLIRNETGFISIMSILAIGQLDNEHDKFKIIYFLIFIISLILMLTKNGYF